MITNLQELIQHFENKANVSGEASVLGIVVNSTFPLFRPSSKDYIS